MLWPSHKELSDVVEATLTFIIPLFLSHSISSLDLDHIQSAERGGNSGFSECGSEISVVGVTTGLPIGLIDVMSQELLPKRRKSGGTVWPTLKDKHKTHSGYLGSIEGVWCSVACDDELIRSQTVIPDRMLSYTRRSILDVVSAQASSRAETGCSWRGTGKLFFESQYSRSRHDLTYHFLPCLGGAFKLVQSYNAKRTTA